MQHVLLDRSKPVWVLTINRPEVRNAMARQTLEELDLALAEVESAPDCRALIVTGAKGHFVAGGDLRELQQLTDPEAVRSWSTHAKAVLSRLESLPVPVIAAIEGNAVGGGCELALACDLRIAGESARFKFWEIKMAVTTGWGGGRRLVNLVGKSRAMELLLTGESVNAVHAAEVGLVNHLVPDNHALQAAITLANHIAGQAPLAVREMKALLTEVETLSPAEADARETERFVRTWMSEDHVRAVDGYFQRRAVKWQGR